jgi:hypothetical protein
MVQPATRYSVPSATWCSVARCATSRLLSPRLKGMLARQRKQVTAVVRGAVVVTAVVRGAITHRTAQPRGGS